MLGGIIDSDSDVIIIEESFVDPGFELQSLSKSSNNVQEIWQEFPPVMICKEAVNPTVKSSEESCFSAVAIEEQTACGVEMWVQTNFIIQNNSNVKIKKWTVRLKCYYGPWWW